MMIIEICILIIILLLCGEFLVRFLYYRKQGHSALQRIKLILFGRWLLSDEDVSPLYLKEIATSLGIPEKKMVEILAEASEKSAEMISAIFLAKTGVHERYQLVPGLGFLPLPSQDLIHLRTNNLGFRGENILEKKPPHVKRVLILGGSVAFGRTATSEKATISRQLEALLNNRSKEDETIFWEVINMAVPDFISIQECSLLIKTGLQFNPDIVISLSGINDAHHYLETKKINEPASFRSVKTAYHAFFGPPIQRFLLVLGTYSVAIQCLLVYSRSTRLDTDEELSPFIYTIW